MFHGIDQVVPCFEIAGFEGARAGEEFVQQNAEAVDVGARVDVLAGQAELLRTHVGGGADELPEAGGKGLLGQGLLDRLGNAEVDDFRGRPPILQRDQDVRRLEIAMDDPFLVRVLNGAADLDVQGHPLADGHGGAVAELGNRLALDELHGKERPARVRGTAVEDVRDARVVHDRERLALRLEARDHLARVHPELDDLERDAPRDRRRLFGEVDRAHAAFAERPEERVWPDVAEGHVSAAAGVRRASKRVVHRSSPDGVEICAVSEALSPGTGPTAARRSPGRTPRRLTSSAAAPTPPLPSASGTGSTVRTGVRAPGREIDAQDVDRAVRRSRRAPDQRAASVRA